MIANRLPRNALVAEYVDGQGWKHSRSMDDTHIDMRQHLPDVVRMEYGEDDLVIWKLSASGRFSSRTAWEMLRDKGPHVGWKDMVWFGHNIPKHAFVLWRVLRNALPTRDQLIKRNINVSKSCAFCWVGEESVNHLFFECAYSKAVWEDVQRMCFQQELAGTLLSQIMQIKQEFLEAGSVGVIPKLALGDTVYHLWMERNKRIFEGVIRVKHQVCDIIKLDVLTRIKDVHLLAKQMTSCVFLVDNWNVPVVWQDVLRRECVRPMPSTGSWALHGDGSVVLDRGSYGGVVRDCLGSPIFAFTGVGGNNAVLDMEMIAILRGLELVVQQNIRKVSIRSDSMVAIKVLKKEHNCPWQVMHLRNSILQLCRALDDFELIHVWREQNQPADYLASLARDVGEVVLQPLDFDQKLNELIQDDLNQIVFLRQ